MTDLMSNTAYEAHRPFLEKIRSDQQSFWDRVVKSESGCWIWTGPYSGSKYGKMYITVDGEIKHVKASRISVYIAYPDADMRLHVLHKCDNPKCVNPDHLYLGTQEDNTRDMVQRKRTSKGERHSIAIKAGLRRSEATRALAQEGK